MSDRLPPAYVLNEIAQRQGVTPQQISIWTPQGAANWTFAVGDSLVLRVARAGFDDDLQRELTVIPHAAAAGVPVPQIVDHGVTATARPYLLQTRCPGVPLAVLPDDKAAAAYRDLGATLRRLHAHPVPQQPGVAFLPVSRPLDIVDDLSARAWIGPGDADWLRQWLRHLEKIGPVVASTTLLHGDAAPSNVLADPDSLTVTGLLDWGDTAIGDPAVDLAKIPPRHLPAAVSGYTTDETDPLPWAARVLTHQVHWALGRLPTPPRPHDPSWSAPPAARILGMLRLLAHMPSSWSALLPEA